MKKQLLELINLNKSRLLHHGFLIALLICIPKFPTLIWEAKALWAAGIILLFVISKKTALAIYLWITVLVILGWILFETYFITANHIFLLFYIGMIGLLAKLFIYEANSLIDFNSKMILSLLLFFGGLQKILSVVFLNGDLLHYMFLRGELASPLFQMDVFQNYFLENQNAMKLFDQGFNYVDQSLFLKPLFNHQHFIIYGFSIFVIAIEFALALLVWIKNQKIKFICFATFLVGLLFTRMETGFASLLCLLLALQLPIANTYYKIFYLVLFCICSLLIVLGVGLH